MVPRGPRESMPVKSEERKCLLPSGMRLLTVPVVILAAMDSTFCSAAGQKVPLALCGKDALVLSGQRGTFHFFEDAFIICISTSGCFPFPVA